MPPKIVSVELSQDSVKLLEIEQKVIALQDQIEALHRQWNELKELMAKPSVTGLPSNWTHHCVLHAQSYNTTFQDILKLNH